MTTDKSSEREALEAFERLREEQKWVPGMPKLAGARPAFVAGFLAARAALPQQAQDLQAWLDVVAERRRQIEVERWTELHDDDHDAGELSAAGASYAIAAADDLHPLSQGDGHFTVGNPPTAWPWDDKWWKPGEPRRMLVKAAALILAEIERLDRAAIAKGERHE